MRSRFIGRFAVATAATVVLSAVVVSTQTPAPPAGQAPAGRGAGRGRGAAGPPEPTPRLADGTVNLGRVAGEKGIWNVPYITNMGMQVIGPDGQSLAPARGRRGGGPPAEGGPPAAARGAGAAAGGGRAAGAPPAEGRAAATTPLGGGEGTAGNGGRGGAKTEPWVPFQPWAAAVYDYNSKNSSKYDPEGYCLPPGGPRLFATPYPAEIIQLPEQKRIIMIFEGATHIWREIYMDGREHPKGDALNPTYLGHSVGRWEGDTLVVDVVGFNEATWLDYFGHPHTDQLHVVEKYTRPNKGTLHYEALIDDPGAYTKPFTVAWDVPWRANGELTEYICQENNKYLQRLTDDFGKPIFSGK